jgi:hypothetical protein
MCFAITQKTAQITTEIEGKICTEFKPVKTGLSISFYARSQNCEKRLLPSSCPSVCLSARKEKLGFHWVDFYEI